MPSKGAAAVNINAIPTNDLNLDPFGQLWAINAGAGPAHDTTTAYPTSSAGAVSLTLLTASASTGICAQASTLIWFAGYSTGLSVSQCRPARSLKVQQQQQQQQRLLQTRHTSMPHQHDKRPHALYTRMPHACCASLASVCAAHCAEIARCLGPPHELVRGGAAHVVSCERGIGPVYGAVHSRARGLGRPCHRSVYAVHDHG